MKATILFFSPSSNTGKVARLLEDKLAERQVEVQLINLAGDEQFFVEGDIAGFLENRIEPHDVLIIGSPVYSHRFQYHVKNLIRALPKPGNGWGAYAVPFVTYGSITSGIALEEAGRLLKKSGRMVPAGMKIAASHCMSDPILGYEFNKGRPNGESDPIVDDLVERILALGDGSTPVRDASSKLAYQSRLFALKTYVIFNEETWHEKRYPKIVLDTDLCKSCGKCAKHCPVRHFRRTEHGIEIDDNCRCIHCLNCLKGCPTGAISLDGDLERGRAFFNKLIRAHGNKEQPESAVYPLA